MHMYSRKPADVTNRGHILQYLVPIDNNQLVGVASQRRFLNKFFIFFLFTSSFILIIATNKVCIMQVSLVEMKITALHFVIIDNSLACKGILCCNFTLKNMCVMNYHKVTELSINYVSSKYKHSFLWFCDIREMKV